MTKTTYITGLKHTTSFPVRFNEVDSLRVVWHGHYLKYFEDGREAFGKKYGMGYLDVYHHGYATPIVKASLDYKAPLAYGDTAVVETQYIDSKAAKILFSYRVFSEKTGLLVAKGETMQVFWDENQTLVLNSPAFFLDWKKKWNLLAD